MIARLDAIVRLRTARWMRDEDTQKIFKVLDGHSDRTRAVGGIVRDTIVDRVKMYSDLDLATELTPQEVMERASAAGMSCHPTGIAHGTVTVRQGPSVAQVTTLRQDIETDGRHAVVKFGSNWRDDARRRDFTINALYASMTGAFHDPLDNLSDLLESRVCFIGDADDRIEEDRLRVFRFFRFTASHGQEICDPDGLAACERAADTLEKISGERVGAEMMRMLALQRVAATIVAMAKSLVLDIEVSALEMLATYEDFTASPVAVARLAVLVDTALGKNIQSLWRLSNVTMNEAREIRKAAELLNKGEYSQAAYRYQRLASVALPVAAAIGDWSEARFREAMDTFHAIKVPNFPINGDDLVAAGFVSGPQLGEALREIEADWVKSGFELDREALLQRLKIYLD